MTAAGAGQIRAGTAITPADAGQIRARIAVVDADEAARAISDVASEAGAGCDVGELYKRLSRQLERIVRAGIKAPDSLIEEACQFAWARLVHHQARVRRETALAWLVQTARREAFKLDGRSRRELSLEAALDERGEIPTPDPRPGPADLYEQRERLRTVGLLSPRQQRLVWLYAVGLGYDELAMRDGCTSRTVERQLQRARTMLRAAELEQDRRV